MPPVAVPSRAPARHDDLDNYDVDQLSDDPFASPGPPSPSKKRKEAASGLGIDEEVSVQKRARAPAVKLDEDRLLGPGGIPKLRERARHLKIKGKGHEFSDAARLLSFYQLWLDDLFPKARFLDALAMVEKAGHKKRLLAARSDWINEGRPKALGDQDEDENGRQNDDSSGAKPAGTAQPPRQLPARPQTPARDADVPDDDDLYDATPRAAAPARAARVLDDLYHATPRAAAPGQPTPTRVLDDQDDLDALIAEAEIRDGPPSRSKPHLQPRRSDAEPNADDVDALIAKAEGRDGPSEKPSSGTLGGGNDTVYADEEAAMEEMEGLWWHR